MIKKTIAIYFSYHDPMGDPFSDTQYFEMYKQLMSDIEEQDVKAYVVRGDSYQGKGVFSKGWHFVDGVLTESTGEINADVIFNRDNLNTIPDIRDCNIINHPDFDNICTDKKLTYDTFPDISPKTTLIHSYNEFQECMASWKMQEKDLVVLKKNFESRGRGIFIIPVKDVHEHLYDTWSDILLQEFVDSSCGIPGIVEGLHDFRVNFINGIIRDALVRTPKAGSFLANIDLGGSGFSLPLTEIPNGITILLQPILDKLSMYKPSLFAADFMNSKDGYKLIELNSRPGLKTPSVNSTYKEYNYAIVEMLVEAVNNT